MTSLSGHFWQWIAGLVGAILALVGSFFALPVLVRYFRRLGWWALAVAAVAAVGVFLFVLPRRYPAADLPDSALPDFLHDGYWAWMLVFMLAAAGSVVALVRAPGRRADGAGPGPGSDAAPARWPDLDAAWDEIIVRLEQARIDPSAQRVYLLIAPDEESAAAVVRAAGLQVFVEAPAGPAPVHAFATSDGLLLSCAGASGLGAGAGAAAEGGARLEALCRKLLALQPDCPVVRGVVVAFPITWASDPDSVQGAAAVRDDLGAVRRVFKVRCPVFAVFNQMETVPGLAEFAARLASQVTPRMLEQRVGFAVPASEPFGGELVQRGLIWMSGWFHSWVLNLLAGDPLNDAGNGQLVTLDHEVRRYRKRLRAIMESAFSTHRENEPVLFRGCYFLASGDDRLTRAFAAGLFRGPRSRVIADHAATVWGVEARSEDRRYRRLALAVGLAGGALVTATWLYIASRTALGWLGLLALAVAWVVALVRILGRD